MCCGAEADFADKSLFEFITRGDLFKQKYGHSCLFFNSREELPPWTIEQMGSQWARLALLLRP